MLSVDLLKEKYMKKKREEADSHIPFLLSLSEVKRAFLGQSVPCYPIDTDAMLQCSGFKLSELEDDASVLEVKVSTESPYSAEILINHNHAATEDRRRWSVAHAIGLIYSTRDILPKLEIDTKVHPFICVKLGVNRTNFINNFIKEDDRQHIFSYGNFYAIDICLPEGCKTIADYIIKNGDGKAIATDYGIPEKSYADMHCFMTQRLNPQGM